MGFGLKRLLMGMALLNLTGCASYYSHYGSFEAMNSEGEIRQHLVQWQTEEYPEWAMFSNASTSVKLTTQCSEREWVLSDNPKANKCSGMKINACGQVGKDFDIQGREVRGDQVECAAITNADSAEKIVDLGHEILLYMHCRPASTSYKNSEGELQNTDYLKASSVPYTIRVRKVERYSFRDKAPKFDDKICKKE